MIELQRFILAQNFEQRTTSPHLAPARAGAAGAARARGGGSSAARSAADSGSWQAKASAGCLLPLTPARAHRRAPAQKNSRAMPAQY